MLTKVHDIFLPCTLLRCHGFVSFVHDGSTPSSQALKIFRPVRAVESPASLSELQSQLSHLETLWADLLPEHSKVLDQWMVESPSAAISFTDAVGFWLPVFVLVLFHSSFSRSRCTCLFVCIHVFVCMYIYVFVHIEMYISIYIYVCVCVCVCAQWGREEGIESERLIDQHAVVVDV